MIVYWFLRCFLLRLCWPLDCRTGHVGIVLQTFIFIVIVTFIVVGVVVFLRLFLFIFRGVEICEELFRFVVIHINSDSFEAECCWQELPHFSEETFVVSLSAYFGGKLQRVDYLLFSFLDLFEGCSALKTHLEVVAYYFEDLFISCSKTLGLLGSIEACFALNYEQYLFLLVDYGMGEELRVLLAILDLLRTSKARYDRAGLAADGVDHPPILEHESLIP